MKGPYTTRKTPRLTLVGAGPGDPDLLTLKALKVLREADIVLFDALVSEEILASIPVGKPVFNVGKRAGAHRFSQGEINELIVEFAHLYGHVVRLKGGDPFVFGRGGEEIAYARRRGVESDVIPGISSALAVPASENIPVTLRGVSESFWVITGTTRLGTLSRDVALAAQSTATVVMLMGLSHLDQIAAVFSRYGRGGAAAAVIQNGTCHNQRSVYATVDTLVEKVAAEHIGSPAIIVIGDVVAFAQSLECDAAPGQSDQRPPHGRVA